MPCEPANKKCTAKTFKELNVVNATLVVITYKNHSLHSFLITFSYPVLQDKKYLAGYLHLKGQ